MSDMRKKNPNNYNNKGQAITLRKITQPYEAKRSRYLMVIILVLMATIILMGIFLIPDSRGQFQSDIAKQNPGNVLNIPMNPVVSAEINMLKAQLVGLISGSIESKVRTLENSVRTGIIASTDMATIQDLKNDLQVLKTYSATGAGRLIAQPELELSSTKSSQVSAVPSDKLLKEISQLKSLVYISIASCGLMLAAVGGVWLQRRNYLAYEKARSLLGRDN